MKRVRDNTGYALWTAGLIAGLPLFAWQAARMRRDTPRLEEAPGPREGRIDGEGPPLRLAAVGESTVAGVGAPDHASALAGQCAKTLAARSGRAVEWHACGANGATARQTRYKQVPLINTACDVVVVALGVNDVLSGCTPETWYTNLTKLMASIRRRAPHAVIAVSAVPPMGSFPAIPQPLRTMLGVRARAFDRIIGLVAAKAPHAVYVPIPFEGGDQYFCTDRFHPSPLGYTRWGGLIGEATAHRLQPSRSA
ncbi:SGNH/GDSL hydrolase family protein [Algiphilus sp.]|uniref:SGNH/GDSL hydrolase family protein n=1 Tax=Algiphilus sp. TaxID=1872431 RepID=UPI0032EE580D|nr:SGNH/GDSL hydrolase family protein [Algiphilus acroporae]MCI5062398.1 SGNH/GDSL hydrolase family protein [Algiphilus sp.]